MNKIDKKYIILGSLCALVLMLVVGYAAFNAVLNIKGTTNINSNWDVKITNVTEGTKVGAVTTKDKSEGQDKTLCKNNLCNPTWDELTANFEVDLVSPGDSIEYVITVSNEGTLDAKLDNIVISEPDNEYITFETRGLKINDTIEKKTSKTLTIKVTFKDVTIESNKPSSSNLTVKLDFSQDDGKVTPIPTNNVVYSFNIEEMNIGDSIEDKKGFFSDKDESLFYLKHEIDSDNKIIASYACFVTDAEYCIQGGDDGAAYETNKALLLSAFGESACSIVSDYYGVSDGYISCSESDGPVHASASYSGNVQSSDGPSYVYCEVRSHGGFVCAN